MKTAGRITVTWWVVRGHDDQLGVLRHPHEESLIDAQLIELPVDEPQRHVDAVQRGEQVEDREAPQRDVLRVQRIAAGAEVRAGLVGEDAIEHAVREPHPAIGQGVEPAGEDAVGVEAETAGDRRARRGDESRDRRRVLGADVLDAQQAAHRMADEQHRTPGRGIPNRFVDRRERRLERELLRHPRCRDRADRPRSPGCRAPASRPPARATSWRTSGCRARAPPGRPCVSGYGSAAGKTRGGRSRPVELPGYVTARPEAPPAVRDPA